jgi:DNA segregation ATPase FtsK/SpoIIIE, S-DNA-T family
VDTRPNSVRIAPPSVSADSVTLTPPPRLAAARRPIRGIPLLWAPVVAGAAALLVVLSTTGGPLLMAVGLVVFVAAVGLGTLCYAALWWEPRHTIRIERRRYLRYIDDLRQRLGQAARDQRDAASWSHPAPEQLLDIARSPRRRFERRPGDADFGQIRVGLGTVDLALALDEEAEANPLAACDPVSAAAAADLRERPRQLPDMPVTVDLGAGITTLVGEPQLTRVVARSIVCQTAAFHDPADVRLAFARHTDNVAAWEWVKWLPHADMVTDRVSEVANLLADQVAGRIVRRRDRDRPAGSAPEGAPRLVVIVDAEKLPLHDLDFRSHGVGLRDLDIHLIHLVAADADAPRQVDQRLRLDRVGGRLERAAVRLAFRPDAVSVSVALMLARQLASRVPQGAPSRPPEATWLPSLRDIRPSAVDEDESWRLRLSDAKSRCAPFLTYEPKETATLRRLRATRPGVPTPPDPLRWDTRTPARKPVG